MQIEGNIIDVARKDIYPGAVTFDTHIRSITETQGPYDTYLCPGYIDPHIHIESTMLPPSTFSAVVAPFGTTAVVADPHEIANVMGMEGIAYMMADARQAHIDIYFSAPSCVPATEFETSGARIGPKDVDLLMSMGEVVALGEMMNYPGVLAGDPDCIAKIAAAMRHGKPVDGHCPGLSGEGLRQYVAAGISTEHECTTIGEAREKAQAGMKVFIREGSSARNLTALIECEEAFAFCTDDRHVGDLLDHGHVNAILAAAVREGKDALDALRMSTLNPACHYGINAGAIEERRLANILVLKDLESFAPERTIWHGREVASRLAPPIAARPLKFPYSMMRASVPSPEDLLIPEGWECHCIGARDGQLVTDHLEGRSDRGWQKLAVVDRYTGKHISACHIAGFGLTECALAQTIAHDSHNIVAVGSDDDRLIEAIRAVISMKGGIAASGAGGDIAIPLPIAGLMYDSGAQSLAAHLRELAYVLREHGCAMSNPVTTLSFMALPVIPSLKLTDRGLFDVDAFSFVPKEIR